MIIFKNSFPGGHYTLGGPDQFMYDKQKSGFMDSELFVKWFEKIFVLQFNASPERSILLLLDGHASHCSPEPIDAARRNNVILLALAPHTTHLCQPLDVSVFKSLKSEIGKIVKASQMLRGNLWLAKNEYPL